MASLGDVKAKLVVYPVLLLLVISVFAVQYVNFNSYLEDVGPFGLDGTGGGGYEAVQGSVPGTVAYLEENTGSNN